MCGCSAFLLALAALSLGACGSSRSAVSGRVATAAQAGARTAASTGAGSPCKQVPAPAHRSADHVPKPTERLDPNKSYVVSLHTNCGSIEIQLDVKRAPVIASSFAYLVKRGFYDGLTFHRVVSGFVIQGGDPNGNGSGGPGYTVVERPPATLRYTRGIVAMAKSATDPAGAAGSQFFIVSGTDVELPPEYALLGQVVHGEGTVTAISQVPTVAGPEGEDSYPRSPVVIDAATLQVS
jgi:peptidyl-prolyl cis-trans isomerase B (cyclophilin B)